MTGKVFDGNPSPAAFLILILPLAAVIVLLYKAWMWVLGFVALIIVWKLVDNYQWQQWCTRINPIFNQLTFRVTDKCISAGTQHTSTVKSSKKGCQKKVKMIS